MIYQDAGSVVAVRKDPSPRPDSESGWGEGRGEISPKHSRIEPLNRCKFGAFRSPAHGNDFSLSLGERAGVRADVNPFTTRYFTRFGGQYLAHQVHGEVLRLHTWFLTRPSHRVRSQGQHQ